MGRKWSWEMKLELGDEIVVPCTFFVLYSFLYPSGKTTYHSHCDYALMEDSIREVMWILCI
jgi:hypothetical protein